MVPAVGASQSGDAVASRDDLRGPLTEVERGFGLLHARLQRRQEVVDETIGHEADRTIAPTAQKEGLKDRNQRLAGYMPWLVAKQESAERRPNVPNSGVRLLS